MHKVREDKETLDRTTRGPMRLKLLFVGELVSRAVPNSFATCCDAPIALEASKMTYRRTHLPLCPHGSPTSQGPVHYACGLSKVFDASLRVTSSRLIVKPPTHWLAGKMLASLATELE